MIVRSAIVSSRLGWGLRKSMATPAFSTPAIVGTVITVLTFLGGIVAATWALVARSYRRWKASLLKGLQLERKNDIETAIRHLRADLDTEMDERFEQHEKRSFASIEAVERRLTNVESAMARRDDLGRVEGKVDKVLDRLIDVATLNRRPS